MNLYITQLFLCVLCGKPTILLPLKYMAKIVVISIGTRLYPELVTMARAWCD